MSEFEVDEKLRAGRPALVPVQGGPARQSVAFVHRAAGPVDPVVSVVAGYGVRDLPRGRLTPPALPERARAARHSTLEGRPPLWPAPPTSRPRETSAP